ncbi:glycosyltransferase family 4 protein [Microbacterium thalassium]|uniref:Glycosyltransferase involved in cell wall biosynthesis n=1 Tax=Microbacterium thalassium TaxID=362649 RepID=A0A7X0FP33_9MICO|nr:glycosyltransferase family 4 protein [Microbacterium thalassium]MBB6391073.1 glycosyltransferase involved in cell wall biosynthesis [Microbacterium thalassium]
MSLALAWPLVVGIVRTPRITVLHAPLRAASRNSPRLRDRIKAAALPRRSTYVVSRWLGDQLPVPVRFMPNPYDDSLFYPVPGRRRSGLLFVGRLVGAKGLDIAVDAISTLRPDTRLTVIGAGPEEGILSALAETRGVRVDFLGAMGPAQIASEMRAHEVLVIPSSASPPEVYPLVAIEGLASGCRVVATNSGGLPEAVGGTERIVEVGDVRGLSRALEESLADGPLRPEEWDARAPHIQRHALENVIGAYEAAITDAMLLR